MINISKELCDEIDRVAKNLTNNEEKAMDLSESIINLIYDLEREDDKNGTNKLERLLERHNAAWFVEEYGLLP